MSNVKGEGPPIILDYMYAPGLRNIEGNGYSFFRRLELKPLFN